METQRTLINKLRFEDKSDVQTLYQNVGVRKYLGGLVDAASFCEKFENMMSDDGSFDFLVRQKLDGAFIGLVNISPYENKSFHQEALSYEVSYQLVPDYWNKRYGSEILGRIFEYAAATLSLKRLWAETQKANLASIRLLEKMGMEHQEQVERFGETQLIYAITLTSDKF